MLFTKTTKELMNFQIPTSLKTKFQKKCNENYKTMSSELIDLIKLYVSQ
jgi:hypothetical protein